MSARIRWVLLVVCLVVWFDVVAIGQPRPVVPGLPGDPAITPGEPSFRLARDSRVKTVLEAIDEHIPEGKWERILPTLQRIIDLGELPITSPIPGQETTAREAGLRLLDRLPEEGKAAYRELTEPPAKALLNRGEKEKDADALLEVLRRYERTEAAQSAGAVLLQVLLDQRRDAEVIGMVARLRERKPLEQWSAVDLWRTLQAALRTGSEDLAEELEGRLLRVAVAGVELDGKKWTRAELEAELTRLRTREPGSVPLPVPTWTSATATVPALREVMENSLTQIRRERELVFVAGMVATTRVRVGGMEREVLLVRGHEGVHCVAAETGKLLWRASLDNALATWLEDPRREPTARQWVTSQLNRRAILDNTRIGGLAIGSGRVCVVDDVPLLATGARPIVVGQGVAVPQSIETAVQRNRLVCIDIATGKVAWETSGEDERLAGWFLGAPLWLGPNVLALHEQSRELRLVQLDGETGTVQKIVSLGQINETLSVSDARRRGLRLVAAQGLLLVPTGVSALVALRLPDLTRAWIYEYSEQLPRHLAVFPGMSERPRMGMGHEPLVVGKRVIVQGPDTRRIHGLDLHSGKPIWTAETEGNDRLAILAGSEGLLVTGTQAVRLMEIDTGKTRWRVNLVPSARGVAVGTRWIQPVSGSIAGELVVLDLLRGTEVQRLRMPEALALGSLYPVGGNTVVVGPMSVALLPGMEGERARLEKRVAEGGPGAGPARVRMAEIERQMGKPDAALATLRKLLAEKPEAEVLRTAREQLFLLLVEKLRTNPEAFAQHGEEVARLANLEISPDVPAEAQAALKEVRSRRQRLAVPLLIEGNLRNKKFVPAAELALDFALGEETTAQLVGAPEQQATASALARRVLAACLSLERAEVIKLLSERMRGASGPKVLPLLPIGTAADALVLERARAVLQDREKREAERWFLALARDGQPTEAAAALEELHRLALEEQRLPDALDFARLLAERHGQKGPLEKLVAEKRFQPLLTSPALPAKWKVEEQQSLALSYVPPALLPHSDGWPGAERWLHLSSAGNLLTVTRRGEDRPGAPITIPASAALYETNLLMSGRTPWRYQRVGHDLLLPLGEHLVVLNPANQRVTWSENLAGPTTQPGVILTPSWFNYTAGLYSMPLGGNRSMVKGAPLPVHGGVVATASANGLLGLEVAGGKVVWRRRDLERNYLLLGLGSDLLVAEANGTQFVNCQWLSMADGSTIEGPNVTAALNDAIGLHEGLLVTQAKAQPKLAVVELRSGRTLWSKEVPASTRSLVSRVPGLMGWIEPTGEVRILEMATQKERGQGLLDAKFRAVGGGALLGDQANLYVVTQALLQNPMLSTASSHEPAGLPLFQQLGSGKLLAFDRGSGKLTWEVDVSGLFVGVGTEGNLPLLIVQAARYRMMAGRYIPETVVNLIDRRTGKLVFEKTYDNAIRGAMMVTWKPDTGTFELRGPGFAVRAVGEKPE